VLPCHFVELALGRVQLFLVLSDHNFVIKVEETSNLWYLLNLEGRQTQEELIESLKQPCVKLWPVCREVVMHKYSCNECQLLI
jgi:hypothetical protein